MPFTPAKPLPENRPIYLRIPECRRLFGLSRTEIFRLREEGKIAVRHVKRPGNARGFLLVDAASVRRYIESFPTEGSYVPPRPVKKEVTKV